MAEEITPPDLIGAGVASPQQGPDASSLMAQLRGPAMPADMGALMAMPRQTPGQAYAQAAAGGVSAMTGAPNPVMQQQQAQQQQAQQYAQMHERVLNRRDKEAEGLLNISKDLLQSESEEARMVGARGIFNHLKAKGQQAPDSLVRSLATRRMGMSELQDVFKEIAMGLDDTTLVIRHPNLDRQTLVQARQNAGNDDTRKLLGLKTSREEKMEIADLRIKEATAMEAESGLKGAPPELKLLIDATHRKIDTGKPYSEGTPETKKAAFDLAYEQYKSAEQQKLAIQQQTEARKALAAERNNQLIQQYMEQDKAGGPLGSRFEPSLSVGPTGGTLTLNPRKPVSPETMQQLTGVADIRSALSRMGEIHDNPQSRKIVDEYIGPYASFRASVQAGAPNEMMGRVPPQVTQLQQDLSTLKNYTVRLITGATMNKEEVPRIEGQIPTGKEPPYQFWQKYKSTVETVKRKERELIALALQGNQQAALEAVREGLIRPEQIQRPAAPPAGASPLSPAPKLPPGTKLEGNTLVSEDGKYQWNGKVWTPR